jgi:SnoaL-like domain
MDQSKELQAVIDRMAIMDCLTRYCRGVDRCDRELILSCYHPDAEDDHGEFVGSPTEFCDWVIGLHQRDQILTQHCIGNHSCEIDGDEAHTETYYQFNARNLDESMWIAGGRYIDRLEKRDGAWKIANRYCVVEWSGTINAGPIPYADIPDVHASGVPGRGRSDPSYLRPLVNKRAKRFPPL